MVKIPRNVQTMCNETEKKRFSNSFMALKKNITF